jgi:hypothetical protein
MVHPAPAAVKRPGTAKSGVFGAGRLDFGWRSLRFGMSSEPPSTRHHNLIPTVHAVAGGPA